MKKAVKRPKSKASRLAASDWVDAALMTMARKGVANVRVERLASDLKVTKGSFYWHFKDRDALLDAMLVRYKEMSVTAGKLASANAAGDPMATLLAILEAPQQDIPDAAKGARMELAIRLWARRSDHVRAMVREIDKTRGDFVLNILREIGSDPARLRPLTLLLQALLFQLWVRDDLTAGDRESLIALMLDIVRSTLKARSRG